MKKLFLLGAAAIVAAGAMQAKTADEVRIYLNAGHGSWGPNDRPMATIPYPNLPETGRPDTCGFYESNTDLWKILKMGETLEKMGVKKENIMYSRVKNGPFPYVSGAADEELYNRNLTEISREVDANNMDMFVSIHSNAATDGTTTNYPLYLYRGQDKSVGENYEHNEGSYEMCDAGWDARYMDEIDPHSYYSRTQKNIRGDWNFYGSTYQTTTSKGTFTGYLGVLRHGTPGFLCEGFFHTYQPARHRALNSDYCGQEGKREARGVCNYFGLNPEKTGDIMGTVKDMHEKIKHALYKYAPNTDDQYLPLNGAVVSVKKNGEVVASYTVDQNYNGVFVFEGLQPGEYTLSASCEGYKDIFEEEPITVTANATSYALLHLENSEYKPDEIVYHNYPDPVQPDYLGVAPSYNFTHDAGTALDMAGTIKRAIVRGDSTVVLTEAEGTPHIYLINNETKAIIKELSLNGVPEADTDNLGFYSRIGDIAFTADGQLVGVNNVRCQFGDPQVDEGYKRGTVRFFKWANLDADPAEWVTTQSSANFYRADMGATLAVSGPAKDCELLITGVTTGTSGAGRFLKLLVNEDEIVSSTFTEKSSTGVFGKFKQGEDMQLVVSPLDDHNYVMNGGLCAPFEFTPADANNTDSKIVGELDYSKIGIGAKGLAFFKYAKHALMVAPIFQNDAAQGVALYDVTNGLDKAQLIKTVGTDLNAATPSPLKEQVIGKFNAAGANVKGADIDLYLFDGADFYKFTTSGVEQPTVRGNYAYDLNYEQTDETFTFKFKTTEDVSDVKIVITPIDGGDAIEIPVGDALASGNEITVNKGDYPEGEYNWEVVVPNPTIPTVAKMFDYAPVGNGSYCTRGMTIDRNPESPYFQNMYVGNPYGTTKGVYEVTPDLAVVNDGAPYLQDEWYKESTASPFRMGVNPNNGYVYIADWCDPHGGITVMNPAEPNTAIPFFEGTRQLSGQIFNADGEAIGGSCTSVAFLGNGEDTKLFSFQEDVPGGNAGNQIAMYDLGTNITTAQVPATFPTASAKMLNTNVEIVPLENGMFVSQIRGSGNNSTSVPSFMYVDYDDNILFNSGNLEDHDGTWGPGLAISDDLSTLAVSTAKPYISIYDVEWNGNTPDLTLRYTITTVTDAGSINNQMMFDHAGNLFVADAKTGVHGVTIPRDAQDVVTPAKLSYIFSNKATAINDNHATKTVKGVKYYNTLGVASDVPFEGINIVVTTYTDGTKSSTKVIK